MDKKGIITYIDKELAPELTGVSHKIWEFAELSLKETRSAALYIEKLKELGLWIFTAEAGGTPYYETDWNCGAAVVMGSEGQGVSRLVKEKSDFIVSIPMYGKVNSLNVSTAASVILCHAARMQRT